MVIHYPPERLRYNSDQPTAITDVLVATSGSSSRTGDIPLGTPPARPAAAAAAGRCTPTATRSWWSGPAAPWSDQRSRSQVSWTVWVAAKMTWTAPPSGRSGSS
jgi:hypothetical protein